MGFFKDLGRAIKGTIGAKPFTNSGSVSHNYRMDREKRNKDKRIAKNEAETLAAETEMSDAANLQIAANRRRRRLSSLFAGGRSVLGAPAGRGAPSGAGSGVSGVSGGSAMGGSARSYGGGGGFRSQGRMYAGEGSIP